MAEFMNNYLVINYKETNLLKVLYTCQDQIY